MAGEPCVFPPGRMGSMDTLISSIVDDSGLSFADLIAQDQPGVTFSSAI